MPVHEASCSTEATEVTQTLPSGEDAQQHTEPARPHRNALLQPCAEPESHLATGLGWLIPPRHEMRSRATRKELAESIDDFLMHSMISELNTSTQLHKGLA